MPDQIIDTDGRVLAGMPGFKREAFQLARAVHPTAGTWAGVYRSTEPINFRDLMAGYSYVAQDEPLPTSSDGIIYEDLLRKIREMEDTVLLGPNPIRRPKRRF